MGAPPRPMRWWVAAGSPPVLLMDGDGDVPLMDGDGFMFMFMEAPPRPMT